MFTGIIEELGTIRELPPKGSSGSVRIGAHRVLEDAAVGDSIAVNGICLTVTRLLPGAFCADVMAETLRRSSLGSCRIGDQVNLERAMSLNRRFGGHIVSGHIDGTGTIRSLQREENAVWLTVEAAPDLLRLIVEKGSIAVDGVSLTVAYVDDKVLKVSIIPHTGEETVLLRRKPGDLVNLENDVIGKYAEKLLRPYTGGHEDHGSHGGYGTTSADAGEESGITMEFLEQYGF